MDNFEPRDPEEELRTAIEAALANMHVAMPVKVMKDSDGKTVSLQPTVKANQRMPDGTVKQVDYPMLDALVHFASGGGATMTHPVKNGDEGMVIFASRSIHNWRENGGLQSQVDQRMHDLSDAIFLPGIRSKPRDLKDINTEAAEMRSDDGKHKVALHPKDGPSMSADGGKHVISAHPKDGITVKTATKLAIDAAGGSEFKGAAHFVDAVTSAKSIGAPKLNGSTGGTFTGIMGGIVGFLLCLGTLALTGGLQVAPTGIQTAVYRVAAWMP